MEFAKIAQDAMKSLAGDCQLIEDEAVIWAWNEIQRLTSAIEKTLSENGHLADGDNCTLAGLKRAIGMDNDIGEIHRLRETLKDMHKALEGLIYDVSAKNAGDYSGNICIDEYQEVLIKNSWVTALLE